MKADKRFQLLEISKIGFESNHRETDREQRLQSLMASMQSVGLLMPLIVRLDKGKYTIIDGHRRFLAAKKLGWKNITSQIVEYKQDERDEANHAANVHRKDITSVEEGGIYAADIDRGLTMAEVAAKYKMDKTRIAKCIQIFKELPSGVEVMDMKNVGPIKRNILGMTLAQKVLALGKRAGLNKAKINELLIAVKDNRFNIDQIDTISRMMKAGANMEEAIEQAKTIRFVRVDIPVKKSVLEYIEKKLNIPYSLYIMDILEKDGTAGLINKKYRRANRKTNKDEKQIEL